MFLGFFSIILNPLLLSYRFFRLSIKKNPAAWQMIHRNKIRWCRVLNITICPCVGMSGKYFALKKLSLTKDARSDLKWACLSWTTCPFYWCTCSFPQGSKQTLPSFGKYTLTVTPDFAFFSSISASVLYSEGATHTSALSHCFLLLGCKTRIAKKGSVQCGCDLGASSFGCAWK